MATGREQSCPICFSVLVDVASTMPCGHQFCLGCILRWLRRKQTCPLCRALITTISFLEQDEDCLQCVIQHSAVSPEASSPAGNAPGSHNGSEAPPASSSQDTLSLAEQRAEGPQPVGGLLPELWVQIFRRRWSLLDPVRSWLQQELERIYREKWWLVKTTESSIVLALCTFGPDRELLVQRLQPRLKCHTARLVSGILSIIIETRCSEEIRRLRRSLAPGEERETLGNSSSPAASQGRAPSPRSSAEDAPRGSPSRSTQP